MNLLWVKRPQFDDIYYSLTEAASLLKTTPKELLKTDVKRALDVFVRVPDGFVKEPEKVCVYSVHEFAVDINNSLIRRTKHILKIQSPDPVESNPVNMDAFEVEGLFLSASDCCDLSHMPIIWRHLFPSGLKINGSWIEPVSPLRRPYIAKELTLSSIGWQLAVYIKDKPIDYCEGRGYPEPLATDLFVEKLYVTTDSLNYFLDGLDINVYTAELFDGDDVVIDRPVFLSEKLNYLIDLAEKYWRTTQPCEKDKFPSQQEKVVAALENKEFHKLCEKGKASKGVKDSAAKFITPIFACKRGTQEERELYTGYITPEIKALMAAAKWFWGRSDVKLDIVYTHPRSEDIIGFFRMHGFKEDFAKFATTIIRPEDAALGRPVKPKHPLQSIRDKLRDIKKVNPS